MIAQWIDQPLARNLIVVAVTLVFIGAVLLVRRLAPPDSLKESNDFVGFAYAFVGVVYGVYLAFAAVVVWEHFDKAGTIVSREAEEVNELWRDASGLPDGAALQSLWLQYGETVVKRDWPLMANSDAAEMPSTAVWNELWRRYTQIRIESGNVTQAAFLAESLRVLNELAGTRRERLVAEESAIPPMMWTFVLGGGMGMMVMTLLIGVRSRPLQIAVTAFIAALLTYAILIVAALADPFGGDMSVNPDMFNRIITTMRTTAAPPPNRH